MRADAVDADLDRLIAKRASTGDPEAVEMLWKDSVRRHKEKIRAQNRWEWIRFFDRMAVSHAALSESYRERAEKLLEGRA